MDELILIWSYGKKVYIPQRRKESLTREQGILTCLY